MPRLISVLAAAILSASVASLLFTISALTQIEEPWSIVVISQLLPLARFVFLVALAHAIILGVPLFFFLHSMSRVGIVACALAGFLVGAAPFGLMALGSMAAVESASVGGKATVIKGVPTLVGWTGYARSVGFVGLSGLVGGLTFWAALRLSGQMAEEPGGTEAQSRTSRMGSLSIVSLAVVSTAAVLFLPSAVKDNSCHNLFRDGRTSIRSQLTADMKLTAEDWPRLRQMFVDFGVRYSLSFRSDENIRHGNVVWRRLNLCSESGVNIDAVDRPWLAHTRSPLADRGTSFGIYELKEGSDWSSLARELLEQIEMTWPHQTIFRGPEGQIIHMEDARRGRQ